MERSGKLAILGKGICTEGLRFKSCDQTGSEFSFNIVLYSRSLQSVHCELYTVSHITFGKVLNNYVNVSAVQLYRLVGYVYV